MNMTEIARKAGVSQSTVSRVLSNSGAVAPEKREKVLRIAEAAGYRVRPGSTANPAGAIGVMMLDSSFANPSIVMRKIESVAATLESDCGILLLSSSTPIGILRSNLRKNQVRGLLLLGHRCQDPELRTVIRSLPHLWLNSHQAGDQHMVLGGNEAAGRLAADYLINRRDCRKTAVLSLHSDNPGFGSRIAGFRFELFTAMRECIALNTRNTESFESLSDDELERFLDEAVTPETVQLIDGLFIPDDRVTAIFHRLMRKRNVAATLLPELVSCNNESEFLTGLFPRPATIDLAPELTAKAALGELLRRIKGEPVDEKIAIVVRPELIEGDPVRI